MKKPKTKKDANSVAAIGVAAVVQEPLNSGKSLIGSPELQCKFREAKERAAKSAKPVRKKSV